MTLNDGNDWNDHSALLDFGFNRFPLKTMIERGEKLQGYELVAGLNFSYPFSPGEEERIVTELVLNGKRRPKKEPIRISGFGGRSC